MSFWDDMELWQKMLFILAVAMALTLIWGFWKLNWRRIKHKKHLSVDLEKSATEANLTESVLKEEIPFGIRALEAGIEVEGVVISRPTSPRPVHNRTPSNMTFVDASSSMGSLMNYAQAESSRSSLGPPSPGLVSSFNQQPTTPLRAVYQPNPYAGISGSTINMPSHQSSPETTRAPSAENLPTLAEQSVLSNIPRTRLSSPPLSNNRVSAMIGSHRRSATYGGDRSGQPNVYGPSRSPSPPDASPLPSLSENQVSDSPDSDSSGSNSEDEKRGTSGYKRSSDQSSDEGSKDLSLMNIHRLSHAAEVGQLTRRPPGPARQSTTSVQSFRPSSTPPNGMIYNTPSSPVYPVDTITPQSPDSLDGTETQHPHRRTLSTFQFNQNVELARELFHPQLAAQPRDENPGGAADDTPTTNRPASIRSKKSAKKLVKKNRHSQSSSSEVDV